MRPSTGTASCCRPTWTAFPVSASTAFGPARPTSIASRCGRRGTYWYHSHSGFQEQRGLYGPLVIEPAEPEPFTYDREHVVMLTDWTDENPGARVREAEEAVRLLQLPQRTVGRLLPRRPHAGPEERTLADRKMWGEMRMNPTDLADVSGSTYTYLMNGTAPAGNWTGLFTPGERVRLRFINGSAMSYFDVRIPGLKMTVVAADGQYVHPVTVDEFRIATAETYDVIVEPSGPGRVHDLRAVERSHRLRGGHAGRARGPARCRARRSIRGRC